MVANSDSFLLNTCFPSHSSILLVSLLFPLWLCLKCCPTHPSIRERKFDTWGGNISSYSLTVRRACWLFLKIAQSAVLRTLVLCRGNQENFFFFWWDANFTFCISHQWEHRFFSNSYASTFKSIKGLWWHCCDIPLALAFSYVSIRSRNKKWFWKWFQISWCSESDTESWI